MDGARASARAAGRSRDALGGRYPMLTLLCGTVALVIALSTVCHAADRRLEKNKAIARRAFEEILSQGRLELAG